MGRVENSSLKSSGVEGRRSSLPRCPCDNEQRLVFREFWPEFAPDDWPDIGTSRLKP